MRAALALAASVLALAAPAPAGDWPQWGGPGRDFRVPDEGLAASWPAAGPPRLWSRALGEGYSAVAAVGGTLYTLVRRGEREVCVALAAASGETVWQTGWPAPFSDDYSMENGPGPHATPLVAAGRLFAVGATGLLYALDAASGELLWRRDLVGELGGTVRRNGYSSSPLAFGDAVIVQVGGEGRAVVALRQSDGAELWRGGDFDNSTSSPILIELAGRPQLVAFLYDAVAGFDPTSGELLWSHPHETPFGLNTSTPVWGEDGLLFVSSAYGRGSRGLRLRSGAGGPTAEEVWFTTRMRLHFGNAVRLGDLIVGSSGDFGPAPLTGLDATTGRVLWRERSLARTSLLAAGERLILLDEDGQLALASASPEGFEIHARADLLGFPARTVPTLAGTTLYLRNRQELVALALGAAAAPPAAPPAGGRR